MTVNAENFTYSRKPKIFNHPERFVEGWYWVIPSQKLRVGEVKPVTILGRELIIYRGEDRQAVIFDAYCPHMGAHLAEGKVEGNELRCSFHHWQFDSTGFCIDIPCLDEPIPVKTKTWPTAEKYGLVWVWTGETPQQPLPFIPKLEFEECDSAFGSRFITNCHPNVFMVNAIDSQHFNTVHKLLSEFNFEKQELNENAITFSNTTQKSPDSWLIKLIRPFYKKPVNYVVCYWYGTTGMATVGTEFLHFHIMFASRLIAGGKNEAMTIFITKKRRGILGRLYNRLILWLSKFVTQYFLKNDSQIFQTIQFNLKTPLSVDQPIMQFINHLEQQKSLKWGTWNLERLRDGEAREIEKRDNREKWRDELVND
ncbi:aromatic ring-hydroxylating dioxygenase subunit alpha [Sphaerospermopsis aphanizomenoides BCCUSP55]|uniref:aromatic ring-hydroxylating dioxygenase subunit alpha n=1 Tax=Sphaerospermopsis aphanizomenoides TaxID=459663 RepID=UPI000AF00AF9|nr:aromatic ring-hydroxylating dioxygenase subunit alpha [Sphaerospermopsis aphanizomenoides]MBK1988255.1 aromatic ring-hydroxylating dioxygenase subunit alpha [Sphaerospermopsis aphanizomenoides BCCUSP55]